MILSYAQEAADSLRRVRREAKAETLYAVCDNLGNVHVFDSDGAENGGKVDLYVSKGGEVRHVRD